MRSLENYARLTIRISKVKVLRRNHGNGYGYRFLFKCDEIPECGGYGSTVPEAHQSIPDMKITETGIGIMAQGNAGVYEHVLSGTFDGMKWELLAICVYEFSGEKVKNLRTVYDRLLLAKQVSKGLLAKKAVNSIIENMEKGLK